MSYTPQLNGSLGGNSLGKLSGQFTVTQPLPNNFSANATVNMFQGKATLGGQISKKIRFFILTLLNNLQYVSLFKKKGAGAAYQINKDTSVSGKLIIF